MFKSLLFLSLSLLLTLTYFGLPSNVIIFSKYWLPTSVRNFLIPMKFPPGTCVESRANWGVSRKKVVGYSYEKGKESYLLMDMDRYEHLQYLKKGKVEGKVHTIACR